MKNIVPGLSKIIKTFRQFQTNNQKIENNYIQNRLYYS